MLEIPGVEYVSGPFHNIDLVVWIDDYCSSHPEELVYYFRVDYFASILVSVMLARLRASIASGAAGRAPRRVQIQRAFSLSTW